MKPDDAVGRKKKQNSSDVLIKKQGEINIARTENATHRHTNKKHYDW